MTFGIETHKAFVNTWECDENVHLNVQFYWRRFGEGSEVLANRLGIAKPVWRERHVRYHRELGMGALTTVNTAALPSGDTLVHLMQNAQGELSATAVDTLETGIELPEDMTAIADSIPEVALPRGLSDAPLAEETIDQLNSNGAFPTHYSIVRPRECDDNGNLLDEGYIARFSDAAGHLWNRLGIDRRWMADRGLGSVAVEMKVSRFEQPGTGACTQIHSWVEQVADKTFTFHHQVSDGASGDLFYRGAVTALMMDHTTRKAVALPPEFADTVANMRNSNS